MTNNEATMLDDLRRDDWCSGRLLAFSAVDGHTDYEDGLTLRTTAVNGQPGLEAVLPDTCVLQFPGTSRAVNRVTGDCLEVETPEGAVRGALLDAHHLLIEGPCEIARAGDGVGHCRAGARTLLGAAPHFDPNRIDADLDDAMARRQAWLRRCTPVAGVSAKARRTHARMLSCMKTQVYSPEGRIRHRWTTPDRWPHRRMWLWDSVFHAVGWRHVDAVLARDMISAVLDTQREDGFVAHMMAPDRVSGITQPPVLALGVKLVHEVAPDRGWVQALYPALCAYVRWDLAHRDSDSDGLVEWAIDGDPACRSGESGMDNSPRFDTATQLDAVDFNAFLACECEVLAAFAAELGHADDVDRWQAEHQRLCTLISDRLWSADRRFFVDYDVERQQQSSVLASSGFLPLICGAATAEQAACLAAHLRDPDTFGTAFPVPSIAVCDTAYYAKDMWRGPTWINVNWLIARGLDRYGMHDLAASLRARTTAEIEACCEQFGVPFEFYDDRARVAPPELLRKGRCAPDQSPYHQVIHDYGWTATLYTDMLTHHG